MRKWGLLSGIAKQHEVWLLSFDENVGGQVTHEQHDLAPLHAACAQIATFAVPRRRSQDRLRTLFTSALPDMAWRLWSPDFAQKLAEWLGQNHFDIVQIEGIEMARYLLPPPKVAAHLPARVVFDDHNCEYVLQQRNCLADARKLKRWHAAAYSLLQWQRLRAFERSVATTSHATLCVSAQDASALQALEPTLQPHVIPNGIDIAAYQAAKNAQQNKPSGTPQTLVFTGKMDYRPNIEAVLWFATQVLPLVQQTFPAVQFQIVGQKPSPRLDILRSNPNIIITGAVDDIRSYIMQADVYVAPLRVGGGTRFKLLEAMALECPIVTTRAGCEGFDLQHGENASIADSAAEFAASVCRLLANAELGAQLSQQALHFAWQFDWGQIVPKLQSVYRRITSA